MRSKGDPHEAFRFFIITMLIAGIIVILAHIWDVLNSGDMPLAIIVGIMVVLVVQGIQTDLAHRRKAWRQDEE